MRRFGRMRTLFVVLVLVGITWGAVHATPPAPGTPPNPPVPASPPPQVAETGVGPSHSLGLPPLKAVLVVGPIDGVGGSWTAQEKANMDLAAAELEANGVSVSRFYTPDDEWAEVTAAAEGAHFFFYRGHGVYWSPLPNPTVGGLSLTAGFVSPDDIRANLHLAPNAIVMLYGCFASGSSSLDGGPISSQEAQRRVDQYSDPFLSVGTAGYYANWFGDAFQMFVRYLFQGMKLGEAYEAFYDFSSSTVERSSPPAHPDLDLWLDKDYWWESWHYNNAFTGLPDQTLNDLFGGTEMEVAPRSITHLVEPDSSGRTSVLHIASTSPDQFGWNATITPSAPWLDVQPQTGWSGQDLSLSVTPSGQGFGTYEASLLIVTDDSSVQNPERAISVTLHVVEKVHSIYLPLVASAAP